jgi:membrane-associated phospholipid phosphatase
MNRFYYLFLLLMVSGSISAEKLARNNDTSFSYSLSDSAKEIISPSGNGHSLLKSAILPVSLVTAGIIVEFLPSNTVFSKERIQQHVQDKMNGFRTTTDNYLQYVPIAVLFGMKLGGVKSRSDLLNQSIITAKSELLMTVVVSSMKYFIHDMRPDGSSDNSMPSGHAAQAFVSATLLDMEYRDTSPWLSVGGYLCAAATGYLRVANNRHWASDVLIGAGIGIVSVKVVYLTHRYKWGKKPLDGAVFVPMLMANGGGVAFAMKF